MITRFLPLALLTGLGFLFLLQARPASAADPSSLPLQAQLIWGTDTAKPDDKSLKPIPPDLDKRLRRIFKWQNYFQVSKTNFVVGPSKPTHVDMSPECRIEVAPLASGEVDILLFGKGKLVVKKRQRIQPGEIVVIAGDDKDYNAWFVVLTQQRAPGGP